jgi:RNA polymerase sigma-70 factor, ECF subfamily
VTEQSAEIFCPSSGTFAAIGGPKTSQRADDRQLAERLRKGDERAWAELCNGQRGAIFRLCIRMLRNTEEARDAGQEVFLKAARSFATYRGDASLKTWLCQIAHNVCLTRIAQAKRESRNRIDGDDQRLERVACDKPDAERQVLSHELREAMERALAELEPIFREAILLRNVEELTYEEIAMATNVSVETVKTRIHRARAKLRQLLAGLL